MLQSHCVILVAVALSLGACKTQNDSVLRASTELDSESVNLSTYLSTPEVLAAYRQEYDRNGGQEGIFSDFCHAAVHGVAQPSYRSRQLPYNKLNIEELVAIMYYSGPSHRTINEPIRYNDNKAKKKIKYSILTTASALNKLPPHLGKVYRGVTFKPEYYSGYSEALKTGKNIVEKSFLSATVDYKIAENFTNINSKITTIPDNLPEDMKESLRAVSGMIIISSKRGRLVEGISLIESEREVLFSPGSEFKVLSIEAKTREEYGALFANAPQPPALAKVRESSDPSPELKGCGSSEDMAKLAEDNKEFFGEPSHSTGPVGDLSGFNGTAMFLNEQDWEKEFKGKIIVIEMEEVTPDV